jgi:hypothetical protein
MIGNGISMHLLRKDCNKSATFFLVFALVCADSSHSAVTNIDGPSLIIRQLGASRNTQNMLDSILYQYTAWPVSYASAVISFTMLLLPMLQFRPHRPHQPGRFLSLLRRTVYGATIKDEPRVASDHNFTTLFR